MDGTKGVICAAMALACGTATAAAQDLTPARHEIAVGVLDHGVGWIAGVPKRYRFAEGLEERGTTDVEIVYRSAPMRGALKPRLTAKAQINTGGRTSFYSVGAEWRQHVFKGRVYGQIGMGLTVQDGYSYYDDPFAVPAGTPEFARRYRIYATRTAFGSRVLLNPNLSVGIRLSTRVAAEAVWEHFSHNTWFGSQNPGIDTVGVRLVAALGRGR